MPRRAGSLHTCLRDSEGPRRNHSYVPCPRSRTGPDYPSVGYCTVSQGLGSGLDRPHAHSSAALLAPVFSSVRVIKHANTSRMHLGPSMPRAYSPRMRPASEWAVPALSLKQVGAGSSRPRPDEGLCRICGRIPRSRLRVGGSAVRPLSIRASCMLRGRSRALPASVRTVPGPRPVRGVGSWKTLVRLHALARSLSGQRQRSAEG